MDAKFDFKRLDAKTRALMVEEIAKAMASKQLYYSTRFTSIGTKEWPNWLQSAAKEHDEHWLAYQLEANGAMKHLETKAKPKGGYTLAHVPDNAAETLAEGQFNRFYIAAICRRALEEGDGTVHVYRGKRRGEPRPESVALEGTSKDAAALLKEVRNRDASLRCDILKPNSGLTVD